MIREELIFMLDDIKTQDECLHFLADKVYEDGLLTSKEEYLNAVYAREKEFSTAVGYDVAMPHGMSDSVKETFICFARVKEPIPWGPENTLVKMIFMIGVPEHEKNRIHLKLISQISKHLLDDDFRNGLLSCKSSKEAFEYLDKINQKIKEEIKK